MIADAQNPPKQALSETLANPEIASDIHWLITNQDALLSDISATINTENITPALIEIVLRAFPNILTLGRIKQWTQLLADMDQTLQPRLKSTDLLDLDLIPIQRNISRAIKKARMAMPKEIVSTVYVFLLRSYAELDGEPLSADVILGALDLARSLNQQDAYAQLHLALAIVFDKWGQKAQAVEFARVAYAYYVRRKNLSEVEIAKSIIDRNK